MMPEDNIIEPKVKEVESTDIQKVGRRQFLQITGLSIGAMAMAGFANGNVEGILKAIKNQTGQGIGLIPEEKSFSKDWLNTLVYDSERRVLKGNQLKYIGMPIGGICAGQVYLGGDGQLWLWDIFNQIKFGVVNKEVVYRGQKLNAGSGANYVDPPEQVHPFAQGFALKIHHAEGDVVREFSHQGFEAIEFIGEYPIGYVTYRDSQCPIEVHLTAFSPYVPLEVETSSNPCIIMEFELENKSGNAINASLVGWLENAVGNFTTKEPSVRKSAKFVHEGDFTGIEMNLLATELPNSKPTILFDDFEKPTYEGWQVEGEAFGNGPIKMADMPRYQGVTGGLGTRIVCSHNAREGRNVEQADAMTGKLISQLFKIDRKYITFMIGGGNHPGETCLNLVMDGRTVRTATGSNSNVLRDDFFDVSELAGQEAHIEIVDHATGGWGNISVDHICFSDTWPSQGAIERRADGGCMAISVLKAGGAKANVISGTGPLNPTAYPAEKAASSNDALISDQQIGIIEAPIKFKAGEKKTVQFMISWSFPNLILPLLGKVQSLPSLRGKEPFKLAKKFSYDQRDIELTKAWHDCWYDSSLPRWLLDRVMGNSATLATMTSTQFANGRFYGWEGIGCCDGTCGHVYQYAQAMARLFPSLERGVREMVDFGVAFHPDSGIIDFRGEYGEGYAVDSQAGYVLRAYREHQMGTDYKFLKEFWPRIKLALKYLIQQDANGDGLIENAQHNTLDVDLYGPSSWLSSLYLAALSAGEAMAEELKDQEFASQCRNILDVAYKNFSKHLWNGEYFIQVPAAGPKDELVYGDGCEVDQVMGEAWRWQIGLNQSGMRRLFDPEKTKKALQAIYKYNFLPNVGPYRDKYTAGRWYALPGEGGLVICTFPKGDRNQILGDHPVWASMYFNECMTGFEYEAAAHMIAEGMVLEGLEVIKTVHDRYDPLRHNPWNEVECSDHYSRCMAVYGAFINICGFEWHGPKGHIGFAPKLNPQKFKSAFTSSKGWGSFEQTKTPTSARYSIELKFGLLNLKTVAIEGDYDLARHPLTLMLNGKTINGSHVQSGSRIVITLDEEASLRAGSQLTILIG